MLLALRASDGQQLWRVDVGAMASQPVVDGDTIYISAEPDMKSFTKEVYALNRGDGSVRWKTEITKTNTLTDTLVLSQGRLFMSANQICFDYCYAAYLFALDTTSGHIIWQRSFSGNINIQTPTVDDGVVYTQILNGGGSFALSAVDGRQLWQRDRGFFQVAGGVVYTDKALSATDPQRSDLGKYAVVALDGKTGAQRWQAPTNLDPVVLAVVGGKVIVSSEKPNPQAPQSASRDLPVMQALDASNGKQLWSAQQAAYGFIVSDARGTFYLIISPARIGGRQQVAALQAAGGDVLWREAIGAETPGEFQHDFGVISPTGALFCLASPNFLYAIHTSDGHTLWTANLTASGQIVGATIVE
jgi:outer membrane protein assembly factor BamB